MCVTQKALTRAFFNHFRASSSIVIRDNFDVIASANTTFRVLFNRIFEAINDVWEFLGFFFEWNMSTTRAMRMNHSSANDIQKIDMAFGVACSSRFSRRMPAPKSDAKTRLKHWDWKNFVRKWLLKVNSTSKFVLFRRIEMTLSLVFFLLNAAMPAVRINHRFDICNGSSCTDIICSFHLSRRFVRFSLFGSISVIEWLHWARAFGLVVRCGGPKHVVNLKIEFDVNERRDIRLLLAQ